MFEKVRVCKMDAYLVDLKDLSVKATSTFLMKTKLFQTKHNKQKHK